MASISRLTLVRNPNLETEGDAAERPKSAAEAEAEVRARFDDVIKAVRRAGADEQMSFKAFELLLRDHVMAFALAAVVLFLVVCEARVAAAFVGGVERGGRRFRVAPARARSLTTIFGVVRYWRTYMREVRADADARRGFHPLDVALGLTADRLSANVLSHAVRLATKVAYAEARSILMWFMDAVPSTEVIEQAVLGLGRHTAEWFEHAPAPDDDGEVLIIHFDSKGAPTATAEELARRRGKRRPKPAGASPRHRGRARRKRHPKKRRRRKGDKSKNAKMATAFVMYTLRREGEFLIGPINKRVYASFGPKEHVFEVARREANKRGFAPASGKTIQVLTDGDTDLALYRERHFPEAKHTIDVMHVIEKLWSAGAAIHREGSDELTDWMDLQRDRLYEGRIHLIIDDLRGALERTPKTGPGNKGKRERLEDVKLYIESRQAQMNYAELLAEDLEIGTGPIEGAVKNIIGKRCDHGGMRWIKERAEALLQLRCIEANGDWDAFINRVHDENRRRGIEEGARIRLQHATAAPLPTVTKCAA